jgi:uncharacterized membrane protein YkoI
MQHEMRAKARDAMRLILEAARFDVEGVDEPLDLSAVRDGRCVLVLCSDDPGEISQFTGTNYSLMVDGQEMTCEKLLFTLDASVSAENCIIWGVKEFVQFAGEAVLADILNRELTLSLTVAGSLKRETRRPGEPTPEGERPKPAGEGATLAHFPVRVTKQDAEKISGIQGTASLRFMPYWVYQFHSSGEEVFRDRRIPFDAEGSGAINAINGIRIEIDTKIIEETPLTVNAEVVQPHISHEEAVERVISETVSRLTQRVRIRQEKGDVIFYEEKVVKPDPKKITVNVNQAFIPVWQIRGKKIIEVNATTGEILSEPMDEGVEIL